MTTMNMRGRRKRRRRRGRVRRWGVRKRRRKELLESKIASETAPGLRRHSVNVFMNRVRICVPRF